MQMHPITLNLPLNYSRTQISTTFTTPSITHNPKTERKKKKITVDTFYRTSSQYQQTHTPRLTRLIFYPWLKIRACNVADFSNRFITRILRNYCRKQGLRLSLSLSLCKLSWGEESESRRADRIAFNKRKKEGYRGAKLRVRLCTFAFSKMHCI